MIVPKNTESLKKDAAGRGPLIVSVIRYEEPVGKRYGYEDGNVTKAASHRSKNAVGETKEFGSFEDFAEWRISLLSDCMLVSGTFEEVGEVTVAYKGNEGPGEVSATKRYLAHREHPGVMIIDIDFKNPIDVAGLYLGGGQPYNSLDAALNALSRVLPEADDCALLAGWSTSSNLFKDGVQVKGPGGVRVYIPVSDASKIPELLDVMHQRSLVLLRFSGELIAQSRPAISKWTGLW